MSRSDERRREWLDGAVQLMGRAGKRGLLQVEGVSMRPTFSSGKQLEADFSARRFRTGDILLFRQSGTLVVHRFLARVDSRRAAGPCLRMRGDGKATLDPPLMEADVLGKVVAIEKNGGWRSLEGRRARTYAVLLAWHDHFWAYAALLAGRADRIAGLFRIPPFFRSLAMTFDQLLLHASDRLLFNLFHKKVPPPESEAE